MQLKEDLDHASAVSAIKSDVEHYKTTLDREKIKYKIAEETVQSDDSIITKIKMQYIKIPCGDYPD